jgi:mRNA interferase RelE/StbE
MSFELAFVPQALKEWKKLDPHTRQLFKAKLAERLQTPRLPSAQLRGHPDRYKIKLRALGYRLVYEVRDHEVLVVVVAVGRRDGQAVYLAADSRPSDPH